MTPDRKTAGTSPDYSRGHPRRAPTRGSAATGLALLILIIVAAIVILLL